MDSEESASKRIVLDRLILGKDEVLDLFGQIEERNFFRRILTFEDFRDIDYWLIHHGSGANVVGNLITSGFLKGEMFLTNYLKVMDDKKSMERHRLKINVGSILPSAFITTPDSHPIFIGGGRFLIPNPPMVIVEYAIPYY
jgi:hypothetical protein